MEEIWKPIKNYENEYQVSNLGRIKSLERYDKFNRHIIEKILIPRIHTGGYLRVGLNKKDFYIHRLVAEAFIPNPKNKKYINHIDGNKKNNNINNLEWCTANENMYHAYHVLKYADSKFMSKIANNENHKKAMAKKRKLRSEDVINIIKSNKTDKELSRIYNITRGAIYLIKKRKCYKEVI